jgi:short-chain fatty acids transporter
MKAIFNKIHDLMRAFLPSPFTLAIILTMVTFILAWCVYQPQNEAVTQKALDILTFWQNGLWDPPLLVFAVQMMLMLVLGHTLALSYPVNRLIEKITQHANGTTRAALLVLISTCIVGFFNWGLGLIFGAVLARKVGEHAANNFQDLNYPLIGAVRTIDLARWYLSLAKVAEPGHLKDLVASPSSQVYSQLPNNIPYDQTVFSAFNLTTNILLLTFLVIGIYFLSKWQPGSDKKPRVAKKAGSRSMVPIVGAEKLDHTRWTSGIMASIILFMGFYLALSSPNTLSFGFINPNYINFCLLGFSLLFHGTVSNFLKAIDDAIRGASGILIQFPLYFGVMGLMKEAGIIQVLAQFFVDHANSATYPIYTFISAAIVNVFVPSGGGQWMVQGPIIIEASLKLGVPLERSILALAYGDELTNMMQPFWALPLLGITGLQAREILPYTLYMMFIAAVVFISALYFFS